MKMKFGSLEKIVLLTALLGTASHLGAAPGGILVNAPDFIIPITGNGTLDLFSDGRAPETSGFNALGRERLTLQADSVSSGTLTLNLHFTGTSLNENAYSLNGTALRFTVRDLDFMGDRVAPGVILRETAALSAINGVPLATLMRFENFLPEGTIKTDNKTLALSPMSLGETTVPASLAGPLVLTFTLTATLDNHSSRAFTMFNTPEHLASDVNLTLVPATVPEPSTAALLGVGALWLAFAMRRRR